MSYECCKSLAFLHGRGMMHCDIKSLNFLVTSDLSIRLADLGEARIYSEAKAADYQNIPRYSDYVEMCILS
jgi:serine/threonine protein kinase